MLLYDLMVFVISKILSVTLSGAGPPFDTLYLIPKSAARNMRLERSSDLKKAYHLVLLGCARQ